MKFLVLALATLAVASSALIGGKTVNVLDDGTIVVRTDTGKQIMISKKMGPFGQHLTEIDVTGPFTMGGKKIQIDENNLVRVTPGTGSLDMNTADLMDRLKRSPKITTPATQEAALAEIMKEFQGIINEAGYEKLLAKLQKSVTKGKLDSTVVDYIQSLAEDMPWHTTAQTAATTTTTVGNTQSQFTAPNMMGVRPLPWYMCNDITCFKQMMMMNGMLQQKAPLMTYDQYMRMNMYNNMRMNPMVYNGQMTPYNYQMMHSAYPVNGYMGMNQGLPIRDSQYDSGSINSDLAARKNFWGPYMNKLSMNSFGSQYDEQPQLPVNREVVDNKLFY